MELSNIVRFNISSNYLSRILQQSPFLYSLVISLIQPSISVHGSGHCCKLGLDLTQNCILVTKIRHETCEGFSHMVSSSGNLVLRTFAPSSGVIFLFDWLPASNNSLRTLFACMHSIYLLILAFIICYIPVRAELHSSPLPLNSSLSPGPLLQGQDRPNLTVGSSIQLKT